MYNKEAMRKLLEDCWDACINEVQTQNARGIEIDLYAAGGAYITTRLAALDDKSGSKLDLVALQKKFDEVLTQESVDQYIKEHPELFNKKDLVADGEGEKVEAGFIKYLVQAKNDFVKTVVELYPHEVSQPDKPERIKMRVACENIIIAYDQMKHKFTSLLPSAVTGGVKWVKASERLPEFEKNVHAKVEGVPVFGRFYEIVGNKKFSCGCPPDGTYVIEEHFNYVEWLDEGQPAQGGKPFMEGTDEK